MIFSKDKKVALVAFCGSRATGPNINKVIKSIKELEFFTIGIDVNADAPAKFLFDDFLVCPKDQNAMVQFVKQTCVARDVDIIICTSTENSLIPLKKEQSWFDDHDIKLPGCDLETLQVVGNKAKMLQSLQRSGIPCPNFYTPTCVEEFEEFADFLNYPREKIVVKPAVGSGNSGFTILDARHKKDYSNEILARKGASSIVMTKEEFAQILRNSFDFPDLVMMEYLPGQDYSVYCFADSGKCLQTVPLKRLNPGAGVSFVSQVDMNQEIMEYTKKVVKHFNLDWNVNVQMRLSSTGQPLVYEINPRVAGSIILTSAAGCDLLKKGILKQFGLDLCFSKPKNGTKMHRYLTEVYSHDGDYHDI